ncbi:MAG: sugar transferase [Pseudomonadota bacterium]
MSSIDQSGTVDGERVGSVSVWESDFRSVSGTPVLAVGGVAKRAMDIAFAATILVALSPLLLFTAGAIRLSGNGTAFYGHERVGLGGGRFSCLKFRTMHIDGDRILRDYLSQYPEAQKEWQETRKLRNDPRVTPLGRVLREYSVDELPQLINVLRGDMSLVGPRPVVEAELSRYGAAAAHYVTARPGITGLWQVSGRSDTAYSERVAFDVHYVTRWSLLGDIVILLRTLPAVLGAKGSY